MSRAGQEREFWSQLIDTETDRSLNQKNSWRLWRFRRLKKKRKKLEVVEGALGDTDLNKHLLTRQTRYSMTVGGAQFWYHHGKAGTFTATGWLMGVLIT